MTDLVGNKPYQWVARRLFLIASTLIALAAWILSGPEREVRKNPILKAISYGDKPEDQRVHLTPNMFGEASDYSEIETYLIRYGFKPVLNPKNFWNEPVSKEGEKTYYAIHGTYACDFDYWVFLSFDDNKKLKKAEGRKQSAACL